MKRRISKAFCLNSTLLFLPALLLAGCGPYLEHSTLKIPAAQTEEDVVTPALRQQLAGPGKTIVVRASFTKNVTASDGGGGIVALIENRLLQAGFVVRDRALLETLLTQSGGKMDYEAIRAQVDTELILDVQELSLEYEKGQAVRNPSHGGYTETGQFDCIVGKLSARVTIVAGGQLGGIFNVRNSPCESGVPIETLSPHSGGEIQARSMGSSEFSPTFKYGDEKEVVPKLATDLVSKLTQG